MGSDVLPRSEDGRKTWGGNMLLKFPPRAASLGFSNLERDNYLADVLMMIYVITASQSVAAESKARTAYKKQMYEGVPEGGNALPLPLNTLPAEPEKLVAPGIIGRIRAAIQRMKTAPGFTDAIGEQLQIMGDGEADSFNPADGKPTFEGDPQVGKVVLDWVKGDFDGVVIESQRGAETTMMFLDKDFKSPFPDMRPNLVAGQPEKRRYRMIYLLDDEVVGSWSDEVTITTLA